MKLHLGCGECYIDGYTHVDIRDFRHIDYHTTLDNLGMIPTNSADIVYACHVLEHFTRRKAPIVLTEWLRVLKPFATLRISVPDFDKLVQTYAFTNDLDLIIGALFGKQDYPYNIHYTVYNFTTLERTLQLAGFKNVRKYIPSHLPVTDVSTPHDFSFRDDISLNIEATK